MNNLAPKKIYYHGLSASVGEKYEKSSIIGRPQLENPLWLLALIPVCIQAGLFMYKTFCIFFMLNATDFWLKHRFEFRLLFNL